ncbi:MAG TPA: hypothetical protein VF546_19930 [Pyrinomonadaceae bacterium]|jgi:hypothetical protein
MLRTPLRLCVALLAFTLGLTTVWLADLGAQLGDAALDRLMGTPKPADLSAPAPARDADAYAVYSHLLEAEFVWPDVRLLVIERRTESMGPLAAESLGEPGSCFAPVALPETIRDYLSVNGRGRQRLQAAFRLPVPYELVGQEELAGLGPKDVDVFWTHFNARYPGAPGLLTLSAVGFNEERTQAIVYATHACGDACGGGTYYVLERRSGGWEVVRRRMAWRAAPTS